MVQCLAVKKRIKINHYSNYFEEEKSNQSCGEWVCARFNQSTYEQMGKKKKVKELFA